MCDIQMCSLFLFARMFTMETAPRKCFTMTPAFSTSHFIAMTMETFSLAVGHQWRWVLARPRCSPSLQLTWEIHICILIKQLPCMNQIQHVFYFGFRLGLEQARASMWMWHSQEAWTPPWEMLITSLHSGTANSSVQNTVTQADIIRDTFKLLRIERVHSQKMLDSVGPCMSSGFKPR